MDFLDKYDILKSRYDSLGWSVPDEDIRFFLSSYKPEVTDALCQRILELLEV